jgi:CheY-like chemotaxis protein
VQPHWLQTGSSTRHDFAGQSQAAGRRRSANRPRREDDSTHRNSRVVLIVDDDADIRDALRTILQDEGYETLEASHGREALSILRERAVPPALVLLDLMMPTMDGWQLRARLREDPALAEIPIVIMTAHAAFQRAVINATPDTPLLPKPIDVERLLDLVATFVHQE